MAAVIIQYGWNVQMQNNVIEFRIVDDRELPPIVISMDEEDRPKVVLNSYYRIWMSLHRKTIGGCAEELFGKINMLLDGFLGEQRYFELTDESDNDEV